MGKKALLVIDVQNDFISGSLAVAEGEKIVPLVNALKCKENYWDLVVLSQDWHPAGHSSFSSEHVGEKDIGGNEIKAGITTQAADGNMLWPDHCIQESWGSQFHQSLIIKKTDVIIQKGTNPEVDSYSAFVDNNKKNLTGLYDILDKADISDVYVCGLATDYCVNYTCQDAIHRRDENGVPYNTHLIIDACRGVAEGSTIAAIESLTKDKVKILAIKDL